MFQIPGWTPNPDFVELVEGLTAGPRWVCEYQYDEARRLIAARADLVVWVDPPKPVAVRRVVRRRALHRVRRQELWNGNQEGRSVSSSPTREHVVRYAWATRHGAEQNVRDLLAARPDLPVVHLRSRRRAQRWLRGPLVTAR